MATTPVLGLSELVPVPAFALPLLVKSAGNLWLKSNHVADDAEIPLHS
jgi:hypothetical protein